LTEVIDDSLSLLNSIGFQDSIRPAKESIHPDLFEQCLDLCKQITTTNAEPIRTIHHLSCTGGTLLTKCLAAMPNVKVMNEVDPISTMNFKPDKPAFSPTDIISLTKQGLLKLDNEVLIRLFLQNLDIIHAETVAKGYRLLLRDHTHGHFLTGPEIRKRPTMLFLVRSCFKTKSLVTVRDPVDSFLSLEAHGWFHFEPKTFDEYCRRYNASWMSILAYQFINMKILSETKMTHSGIYVMYCSWNSTVHMWIRSTHLNSLVIVAGQAM